MEQLNFHKQKLYALVLAAVALISLLLPWISIEVLGYSQSVNGFRGWGILSLIGIIGVVGLSFLGNRADAYTEEFRKFVMICFGAIAVGALLFFLRRNSISSGVYDFIGASTGIGLWLCLIAGVAGFALTYGLIKIPNNKKPL